MSKRTLYLVCEMRENMLVRLPNSEPEIKANLKLTWADGMIGCMPVFETMDNADKYLHDSGSNADVLEVHETEKTEQS